MNSYSAHAVEIIENQLQTSFESIKILASINFEPIKTLYQVRLKCENETT